MSNLLNIKDQNGNWIPIPVITNGIKSITQNQDYTLTITLNDGTTYTTTSIKGEDGEDYILTEQDKQEIAGLVDTPVDDVQINGSSIVEDGVANVPVSDANTLGLIKIDSAYGLSINSNGAVTVGRASDSLIKAGSNVYKSIVPYNQHESVFYGFAKVAGYDEKDSTLPVGEYSEEAKIAIQKMLGIYEAPWELLNEFTLTEEGGFDLTTDDNGIPYDLRGVLINVYYPANLSAVSVGYGRYYFYDDNNRYLVAETGKYTASTNYMYKHIMIERKGNLTECRYTDRQSTGGAGSWRTKNMNASGASTGFSIVHGNIKRIKLHDEDKEPGGAIIKIYGQKAY